MYKIKCNTCSNDFMLSPSQKENIKEACNAGIKNIILECSFCPSIIFVNPFNLLECPTETKESRLFCCPISNCIGFVEKDEESEVFGCSECGTEWKELKEVYRDIKKITQKYPYRKKIYFKKNKLWESILFERIPEGYYDKVQKEEID